MINIVTYVSHIANQSRYLKDDYEDKCIRCYLKTDFYQHFMHVKNRTIW